MIKRLLRHTLTVIALVGGALLAGCASGPTTLDASALQREGVVVGRFAGLERFGLGDSEPAVAALIDDREAKGALGDGTLLLTRAAGEYTLSGLYSSSPVGYSAVTGPAVITTSTRSVPIQRRFSVQNGQILNLGVMLFLPAANDPKRFQVVQIDDSAEVEALLRATQPQLFASATPPKVVRAAGNYVDGERLLQLRAWLAQNRIEARARAGRFLVAADAGTLAEVESNGRGTVRVLRLLNSPSFAAIRMQAPLARGAQVAFVTGDGRLFISDGTTADLRTPPAAPDLTGAYGSMAGIEGGGLVIGTNRGNFYWTRDAGRSWTALPASQTGCSFSAQAVEINGTLYASCRGAPRVWTMSAGGGLEPIAPPPELRSVSALTVVRGALVVTEHTTQLTANTRTPLFVRAAGAATWDKRQAPGGICTLSNRAADGAEVLRADCDQRNEFISRDLGVTWERVAR